MSLLPIEAKPPIHWIGGKRKLLPQLRAVVSKLGFNGSYHEPFVGGAALFYDLAPQLKRAWLNDRNELLINLYEQLRDEPNALQAKLDEHAERNCEAYYYEVRAALPMLNGVKQAAAFIYLNRAGYRGLCRFNKAGGYNVAYGHRDKVEFSKQATFAAAEALKIASLSCGDYARIRPEPGDLIYCDPPYDATFNEYHSDGFGVEGQARLAEAAKAWRELGCQVIVSNSDTERVRRLYAGFTLIEVAVKDVVSARSGKEIAKRRELIIHS